jgi:hypothetical protein
MPKTSKKKRDPNKPKRPLSAFFLFMIAERKKVQAKHPEMKAKEIAIAMGAKWRKSTPKKKSKFEKEAKKLKEKYEVEKKAYLKTLPPKRPKSAYLCFCSDQRPDVKKKFPDKKMTDIAKELGQLWRGISPTAKGKYARQASKLKTKYEKAFSTWSAKQPVPAEG